MKTETRICLAAAAVFVFLTPAVGGEPATPDRPNIVLLLADDLGYGELGCQGNPQIPTPRIDSLARDGIRFTAGYVTAAYCSASRAGLMTGRYQTRFGYEFNPIGARNEDPSVGLPASQITLARLLHDAGYTTALVGKWHLGGTAAYHPLRRGFDEFFGFLHEGHFYVPPPYLTAEKPGRPHEVLFWRAGSRTAVRRGDWKLVRNSRRLDDPWELFHLADDIRESKDLSGSHPERMAELKTVWQEMNSQMVEPAWR